MSKLKSLQHLLPVEEKQEFFDIDDAASEDGEDEQKHAKLLDTISKLGKTKKFKITQRTEPVSKISEHALVQIGSSERASSGKKVKVDDLLKVIANKPRLGSLQTAVKQATKRTHINTLTAPLEKPQQLRVERAAGYEKIKEEVSRWDETVKGNRIAEQLIFPLNQPSIKMHSSKDFAAKFKPKTPLEEQISELLRGNKHIQAENEELTPAEKEALTSMSLKEALERRKELARSRALQSYQETKARRQNKIKSKTYHRLMKREKMKNHIKEFEELKEHNPEGALEKLEQLEKKRIEERMTLKHKGAGKWAKLQAIRSKYDQNARESLADQLRIGKEVTRKIKKPEDESDEEILAIQPEKNDNPWLGGSESTRPTSDITSGYRKLWNSVNEGKQVKAKLAIEDEPKRIQDAVSTEEENDEISSIDGDEVEEQNSALESQGMQQEYSEQLDESLIRKSTMEDFDQRSEVVEKKRKRRSKKGKKEVDGKEPSTVDLKKAKKDITDIDPSKFILMKDTTVISSSAPVTEEGVEEDDEEEQRRMTLAEAFADDDVIEQFKEEKKRIVDAAAPKDIDLTLPGWGEWGGAGVKISNRKKKKFIIKAPQAAWRRDDNKGNLIINEDKNVIMRGQQVNDLPFPFRSAAAFESTIRAPVTSTFIPESAVRKLAAPKVLTKIGTVIAPMTNEVLVANANRKKELGLEDDKKSKVSNDNKRKRLEGTRSDLSSKKALKSGKPTAKTLKKNNKKT